MLFSRPLGLILVGGGSHGAWQLGAVAALAEAGLSFDRVIGTSIGSITGAAYVLDEIPQALKFWRGVSDLRLMRFSPRLSPFSLFSDEPLWETLSYIKEETAKSRTRCEFTVVALCKDDGRHHYARFTPNGAAGWDGPLVGKLIASCAIPKVFPPVRLTVDGVERQYIDGGAIGREWPSYEAMAGCSDVLLLHMFRPEEVRGLQWVKRLRRDPLGRDVESALAGLLARERPPRVWRLVPSRRLGYSGFWFRTEDCAPAIDLGYEDARAFLKDPGPYKV
ncbi:MAG: patatin-like phospholipase family protein [Elusimicrobia bacterium]|nr:patatin-like phospholipase family protein [Elusimicrobiota bacterium]